MKKIFENINLKKLKNGSYSILFTVAVIAVVMIINLIINEIPSRFTKFDVSDQKMYSVGEQTKKTVSDLTDEVTVYYIVQKDNEDGAISKMLERYQDFSKHLKVVKKDPVLNPNFASAYTEGQLSENSLIVVKGDKSKVLQYNSLYTMETDPQTMQNSVTGFDGEGQLTSAISYVTSENTPIVYQVEGHGEQSLPGIITEAIEKDNMDVKSVNLLTQEKVPDDAASIIICSPAKDFSKEETEMVLNYLENGGKALVFSDYTKEQQPNFESIMESYGVKAVDGIVLEADSQHYYQQPYYLVPEIGSTDITNEMVAQKRNVLLAGSAGIQKLDQYRDTLSISSLLSTSDSAYSKSDVENMSQFEKEKDDIVGPFDLGVAVSESLGDNETQMVYFSTSSILDENMNQMVSGANQELVMKALSWMCKEDQTSVSIASKSLQMSPLTLTQFQISVWSMITLILIPGVFIVLGFVIWLKRRKQ